MTDAVELTNEFNPSLATCLLISAIPLLLDL